MHYELFGSSGSVIAQADLGNVRCAQRALNSRPMRWRDSVLHHQGRRRSSARGATRSQRSWQRSRHGRQGMKSHRWWSTGSLRGPVGWVRRAARFESGAWPTARMVRGSGTSTPRLRKPGSSQGESQPASPRGSPGPAHSSPALVEWTRRYGDVPTMADWDPQRARRLGQEWRIARYHEGDWPSARTVTNHFGSFSNALAAAGLSPRDRGRHRVDRSAKQAANRLTVASVSDARPWGRTDV